nr:TnsA endonuclease N-terminal domain-containing protein [Vibrio sp. B4-6]
MSSIESEHFHLAEFSHQVVDIREQFPLFPLNLTQKIAKTLGVEHPKHPKTKEPVIITTDQLLTIDSPKGTVYHAVSVKPEDDSSYLRVLEKIDIERVFWELLGIKFCSGQLKLATVLEFSQYNRSDSLGVRPPLY